MKIFDFFKKLFHIEEEDDDLDWFDEGFEESIEETPIIKPKKRLDLNDPVQLETYVVSCCEQMKDSNLQIEDASAEYRLVTEYLMDMENLGNIEGSEWKKIEDTAKKLENSGKVKELESKRTDALEEDKYRLMERYESEVVGAIKDLKANEDYKALVREDLKNLEGEKVSYRFRERELKATMKGAKEVTVIILMAVFFIIMILAVLQFSFNYEVSIGYFITISVSAIAITLVFLNYNKAKLELRKVSRLLHTAISTQNTVKIRYVNVTSVIDYMYAKYKVNSSNELNYLWNRYIKEKKIRDEIRKATEELEGSRADLIELLRKGGLKYPEIWLNQSEALLDERELIEIRHDLIARRQGLRKRVDYNERVRKAAQDEVRALVDDYPKSANLIVDIVGRYE